MIITSEQQEQLDFYVDFLHKWNSAYNLTAIRDKAKIVTHHIVDSVAVVPYLAGCQRVLDVGTGAGLPGVVIAILCPYQSICLLDSNGKKIRFLKQLKHELKINNIEIIQERIEKFQTTPCFDGIISRAFGSINELIQGSKHLLCSKGHWYAMKGNYPEAELKELAYRYRVEKLTIPELEEQRHLVIVEE